jgi:hypothetical protein
MDFNAQIFNTYITTTMQLHLHLCMQVSGESVEDYKSRLRKRLLTLRERIAALPGGVAAKICIVCVRRASTQSEECLQKVHAKVSDEFGKTDAVLRLDTPLEHMQSSSGCRDWEQVKKSLEACFSAVFVQRLAAYDMEVRALLCVTCLWNLPPTQANARMLWKAPGLQYGAP